MPGTMVVVLGAGASYDCATAADDLMINRTLQPPLVTGLFGFQFQPVLGVYQPVAQAAPELRAIGDSKAFEQVVREQYRDSANTYDRRTFRSMPLYLQHLFWNISWNYTRQADHYEQLVRTLLRRFDEVIFVTLNYDLLLDRVLSELDPIERLGDYVGRVKPWRLIKLHGSVNWGRPMLMDFDPQVEPEDEFLAKTFDRVEEGWFRQLGPIQLLPTAAGRTLRELRYSTFINKPHLVYPSLSVPVGEYGEFSCPPEHLDWLRDRLRALGQANLMMIGYSGADEEVMSLLGEYCEGLQSLCVVDPSEATAMRMMEHLTEGLFNMVPSRDYVETLTFQSFVQTRLSGYLGALPD
jgi:hypothetical protein